MLMRLHSPIAAKFCWPERRLDAGIAWITRCYAAMARLFKRLKSRNDGFMHYETLFGLCRRSRLGREAFLIILLTAILRLVLKFSLDRLARQAQRSNNYWDDALVGGHRPAGIAVWALGISLAAEVIGGDAQAEIAQYIDSMRDVAIVWLMVWFALHSFALIEEHYIATHSEERSVDQTTASAVGKLLRATVAITGTLLVLQAFGVSVSGVLAFCGGIGGIAIGFAARDLLANFFGALMIFLDRPFSVGDWVRSPDRDIEGTVEDIGWRLTRIRTFDKRPLYLPNSIFF